MDIHQYIAGEMSKPFLPGQTDCATTADRWFALRRGFSAMEHFGRPVKDTRDMETWLAERGGLVRGMVRVMRTNGARLTSVPRAGAVGIIAVGTRMCIALYNGETWWSRDADGCIVADDTYRYKAWNID